MTVGGRKWPIVNTLSCHIFRTFKKLGQTLRKSLQQKYLAWTPVCGDIHLCGYLTSFFERTCQTTVGAILVDSH